MNAPSATGQRVLITGAGGQLGGYLRTALEAAGATVPSPPATTIRSTFPTGLPGATTVTSTSPIAATSDAGSRLRPEAGLTTRAIRTTAEDTLAAVFGRIDHIGVAVADLESAIELHTQAYGMPLVHRETIVEQGVEAVLLDVGESHVELLRPLSDDTPVGRFLARRGPGMHHLALQAHDVEGAVEELAASGVHLIDEAPRRGLFGLEVAFVHPDAVHGVLTEVVSSG